MCCFSAPEIRRARSSPKQSEAILNKLGAGRFRAFSAGSHPKGKVNPHTLQLLEGLGYDTSGFRSKSWDEFAKADGTAFDFVFTVCDNAAAEACPVWPSQPLTAHWGIPDPAAATGTQAEIALTFKDAYRMLHQRIGLFVSLPIRSLDRLSLQHRLKEIGRMEGATRAAEPA
jgi:arsenate reductase (thioredoxin)